MHSERARWRRDLVLIVALVAALFGAYVIDRDNQAEQNRTAIIDAIDANCETNFKQDERLDNLIDLFVQLAQENLEESDATEEQRQSSLEFLRDFGEGEDPVNCEAQRERIETVLSG